MCPRGRPRGQGRPRGLHLCMAEKKFCRRGPGRQYYLLLIIVERVYCCTQRC